MSPDASEEKGEVYGFSSDLQWKLFWLRQSGISSEM